MSVASKKLKAVFGISFGISSGYFVSLFSVKLSFLLLAVLFSLAIFLLHNHVSCVLIVLLLTHCGMGRVMLYELRKYFMF